MVFLGIDWGKILSLPFWLDVNPGELSPLFEKFFLGVTFSAYLIYFLSKLWQKRLIAKRQFIVAKLWQKIAFFVGTMAVSFSFIFFFRYEAIPVLGGRFWVLIWGITGIICLVYLLKFYFQVLPKQLKELQEKQRLAKYLGNSKK